MLRIGPVLRSTKTANRITAPLDDALQERRHVEQVQAVVDGAEQERADDGPHDGATAAGEAGAADDHRGDGGELEPLAGRRLCGPEARGEDEPGDRREDAPLMTNAATLTRVTGMPDRWAASRLSPVA